MALVASPRPISTDTIDRFRFILDCPVKHVPVTEASFGFLQAEFEAANTE